MVTAQQPHQERSDRARGHRRRVGWVAAAAAFIGLPLLVAAGRLRAFEQTQHPGLQPGPTEVEHLVEVSGYSYPSGHSLAAAALYLTMAIVAGTHLRAVSSKAVLMAGAALLVALVALSRVYPGVHYRATS